MIAIHVIVNTESHWALIHCGTTLWMVAVARIFGRWVILKEGYISGLETATFLWSLELNDFIKLFFSVIIDDLRLVNLSTLALTYHRYQIMWSCWIRRILVDLQRRRSRLLLLIHKHLFLWNCRIHSAVSVVLTRLLHIAEHNNATTITFYLFIFNYMEDPLFVQFFDIVWYSVEMWVTRMFNVFILNVKFLCWRFFCLINDIVIIFILLLYWFYITVICKHKSN